MARVFHERVRVRVRVRCALYPLCARSVRVPALCKLLRQKMLRLDVSGGSNRTPESVGQGSAVTEGVSLQLNSSNISVPPLFSPNYLVNYNHPGGEHFIPDVLDSRAK